MMLSPGVVCYVFKHAPKLTPRAKVLKLADKIMQRRADYVIWTTEVMQGLRGASGLPKRNSIGLRRMLSGQFPWRQKAAERRCRIADATIAIAFVAIGQSDHRTERLCIKAVHESAYIPTRSTNVRFWG